MAKISTIKLPTVIRGKCGTYSGYQAHRRHKEIFCQSCRDAAIVYNAQWKKNNLDYGVNYRAKNHKKIKAKNAEYRAINSEKGKAYASKYRAENVEKMKARYRERYAKNPRAWALSAKRYCEKYPERAIAQRKRWSEANPEKKRESVRRRRARKRGNGHSPYTEAQVLARYGTDCHVCHEPIDMDAPRHTAEKGWERGLHIDHKIAITKGGRDDLENARPSHGLCNLQKSAK